MNLRCSYSSGGALVILWCLLFLSSSIIIIIHAHEAAAASSIVVSTGLRNLGNTCYMNAQLECAFHIPLVREIIKSPLLLGDNDKIDESKETLGLQAFRKLILDMEASASSRGGRAAAAPVALCRSLGIPVMEQQDSQEFWKLLLPALNVPQLTDLYQGAYEDYITAVDGSGRERRREEPFLDLSLEVVSQRSVLESLADMFGTPELLSEAEGNGWRPEKGAEKVDALKGSLLRSHGLPSLLQLHLKRFQYDWQTESMSKLNKKFSFPAELNLVEICSDIGKKDEKTALYDLQSIVVHVGEYGGGHYYCYVRPDTREDTWYRFDDDRITQVSFKDVVQDAYGGKTAKVVTQRKPSLMSRLFGNAAGSYGWGGPKSSAYMLQYVKRCDYKKLYCL